MSLLSLKVMNNMLEQRSAPVPEDGFGEELDSYMSDMAETMYAHQGTGLAAVQVGRLERFFIADIGYIKGKQYGSDYLKVVNPVILEQASETTKLKEGCLSFPGLEQEVERPVSILLEYRTPFGETKTRFFEGFEARVLLHEIDHFEGVTLFNRATPFKRGRYEKKLVKQLNRLAKRLKDKAGSQ